MLTSPFSIWKNKQTKTQQQQKHNKSLANEGLYLQKKKFNIIPHQGTPSHTTSLQSL